MGPLFMCRLMIAKHVVHVMSTACLTDLEVWLRVSLLVAAWIFILRVRKLRWLWPPLLSAIQLGLRLRLRLRLLSWLTLL